MYRNVYSSNKAHTLTAVLAGSGYATDFMFIMIMRAVDHIIYKYEGVSACVIADDVKFSIVGEEGTVADGIGKITEDFIGVLEQRLRMEVSRTRHGRKGKTVALVSSGRLALRIRSKMRSLGVGVERQTRNLGIDFRLGGGRARRPIQSERIARVAARRGRARRLGSRAAEKVAVAADIPASTYGTSSTGVTDAMLAIMRRGVAAATGPLNGRSVSARLLMGGRDPGVTVTVGAVCDWVNAWWDRLVPREDMADALRLAHKTVGLSVRPNAAVRGGAGAFIAALRRLSWAAPRADAVRTRDGTILFFGDGPPPEGTWSADPRSVKRWALDDYEVAVMSKSVVAQDINTVGGARGYGRAVDTVGAAGGVRYYGDDEHGAALCGVWRRSQYEMVDGLAVPWIWPVARAAVAAKRHGRKQGAASLRACVEGGWWTQSRLYASGVAPTALCRCGTSSGTLWHKLGTCRLTEQVRMHAVPGALLKMGRKAVWDPLFSRGVPARPKAPKPPKVRSWWTRCADGAEQLATGTVFTDGASQGWFWRGSRAAWAAVSVTNEGVVLWKLQGVIGEPHPTILRAELTALRETLRMAAAPLTIYVDNKQVVDGFARGKAYCTASATDAADIWREVWCLAEDIGPGIEVRKVRAHTTWWDVVAGRIDPFLRWGNDLADRAAKEALRAAVAEAPHHSYNAQLARAFLWAGWVAEYAASWMDDTTHSQEQAEGAVAEDGMRGHQRRVRGTMPHEVWRTATRTLCRRCAREQANTRQDGGFQLEPCRGSAAGRALAAARGDKNQLWFRHYYSVADMMRRGASLVARSAVPLSLVDFNTIEQLNVEGEEGAIVESADAAVAAVRRAVGADDGDGGGDGLAGAAAGLVAQAGRDDGVQGPRTGTTGISSTGERHGDAEGGVADRLGAAEARAQRREERPEGPTVGGPAAAGVAERNVRRRVDAGTAQVEPDGDGADLQGRRVRHRAAGDINRPQREVIGWIRDPEWLPSWAPRLPPLTAVPADDHDQRHGGDGQGVTTADPAPAVASPSDASRTGHVLRVTGSLVWCMRCAAYASRRWGARLRGSCRPGTGDSTRSRLELLSQGRHPITGVSLG